MSNHYDAIIIGGGPAGSSAALYAHKYGLKTIILDKAIFPRDKICGDAISGKSVRYMRDLNLLDQTSKLDGAIINRIIFGSPNHKCFNIHLNKSKDVKKLKSGFVIKREIFDNFLFKKAKSVSDSKEDFKVREIIYENDRIIGIEGISNGIKEKFYAPILLGCDGANSIIARKLNLYSEDTANTAIAIRCYYKNVKDLSDQIELHFVDEVLPGYFWLFPAGNGIANVGIGMSKKNAKKDKRKLNQILDDVINSDYFKKRFSNAEKLENPKGWNLPLGRIIRKNYGEGFMLLGDAAGLIDPFTGEGIGNAMASAKYAVKVAIKAREKDDYSSDILSEYSKLVWEELGSELKTSSRLQDLANYRFLLNLIINKASKNKEIQELISGMLTNEVPKEYLSNPLFYLKVLFS